MSQETAGVQVAWTSPVETFAAEVSHGMLIVPDGPEHHRVFFKVQSVEEMAALVAVVIEMAARQGGGVVLRQALEIVQRNEPGEFSPQTVAHQKGTLA